MAEDLIYLGKVKFVSEKFVTIEPILFSDPTKKRWEGTIPAAQRWISFPDNGIVFWFKPHTPTLPLKDSYWSGVLVLSTREIPVSGTVEAAGAEGATIKLDLLIKEYAAVLQDYLTRLQMLDFVV